MASRKTISSTAVTPALVSHCTELLESGGPVRSRRMFGGWGFYVDGLFVALMADDRLYLKVNDQTRPQFVAAAGLPFVYEGKGQPMQLQYCTPPADAMDSPALMQPWVALALRAALAARAAKLPRATAAPSAARTVPQTRANARPPTRKSNRKNSG